MTAQPGEAAVPFHDPVYYGIPTGTIGADVAVGDPNGDGIPDLAVLDDISSRVYVLDGTGGGRFAGARERVSTSLAGSVAFARFDADAVDDLLLVRGGAVQLYRGAAGTAAYAPMGSISGGSFGAPRVARGDVSGDGFNDAVIPTTRGEIGVFLGTGAGEWSGSTLYPTAIVASSPVIADLNRDSVPDVVSTDVSGNAFVVMLGQGAGAFAAPVRYDAGGSTNPSSLSVVDLNGDGHLDLASGSLSDIVLALGDGAGRFGAPSLVDVPGRAQRLAAGDFDGDRVIDLAYLDRDTDRVGFLRGMGGATYADPSFVTVHPAPADDITRYMTMADLNADGHPDLITGSDDRRIAVLLSTGIPEPTATGVASAAGLLLLVRRTRGNAQTGS